MNNEEVAELYTNREEWEEILKDNYARKVDWEDILHECYIDMMCMSSLPRDLFVTMGRLIEKHAKRTQELSRMNGLSDGRSR